MNNDDEQGEEPPPPYSSFDFDTIIEQQPVQVDHRPAPAPAPAANISWPQPAVNECPGCQPIQRLPTTASQLPPDPMYRATYDFVGQAASELSLAQGEIVIVTKREQSGWWLVKRLVKPSDVGWVPEAFLQKSAAPSRVPPWPLAGVGTAGAPQKQLGKGLRSMLKGKGLRHTSAEKVETVGDLSNSSMTSTETELETRRSISSMARDSSSSASVISPRSSLSNSTKSPLEQSRTEKGGNLTFRPFSGFTYESKKGK